MNDVKGLSQILYLIIAASVLMVAALSLVFMLNQGLDGVIGTTGADACTSTVETQCSTGAETVTTPNSCLNDDGSAVAGIPSSWAGEVAEGSDITCANVN